MNNNASEDGGVRCRFDLHAQACGHLVRNPPITTRSGDLNPSHVAAYTFVDVINGPMEMRRSVRKFLKEGVDNIKLNRNR
ncbi:hypothetical protein EDF57_11332 [Novosphingobium sp. PhB55]|nr:hypothetical protein EDF57_11332 [Novosphingobium sp. PhB55]